MPQQLITVGQLIDHAWDHYRKNFIELISISAWLLILAVLYAVAYALYPSVTDFAAGYDYTLSQNIGIWLAIITGLIIAPILGFWVFIALVRLIENQAKGQRTNLRNLSKSSWKLFLPFVFVNILFALLIASPLLALIPGFLLIVLGAIKSMTVVGSIGTVLLGIGIMFVVIMILYWAVRYFFIGYSLILDGHKGRAAFTASRKIIGHRFWPVFWRLVIPKILYFLVFAIIQFILISIGYALIMGLTGLNFDLAERLLSIFTMLVALLITIAINPIILITDYLIYDSAKTSKN